MGYYCPYCGTYLNDTDTVCSTCGRQLDIQSKEASPSVENGQNVKFEESSDQTVVLNRQNDQSKQSIQQGGANNQPQQNVQQGGWNSQPQQNVQQGGWNSQPQQNVQQGGWNSQPQQNVQQGGWNSRSQQNVQQGGWNNQPQQNVQQGGWNSRSQQNVQQGGWNNQPLQNVQSAVYETASEETVVLSQYRNQVHQPQQTRQAQRTMEESEKPKPKMKWFKFVIWLQLFISAIVAAGNAVLLLTGYSYGDVTVLLSKNFSSAWDMYVDNANRMKSVAYFTYPALKMVDLGCGIAYVVLALLAIIVRFRLSGFKKNGPSLYIFYLFLEILVSLAYTGLVIYAIQTLTIDISFIVSMASIAWSVLLMILNMVYFKKRKYLFDK